MLQRGNSGDGCVFGVHFVHDLRKGDLFVLSWAKVRRVMRGSISSELVIFDGVLKYVVCLSRGCGGCCVFCLYCEAWSCRCSCIGRVRVLSMQRFYVCVLCASCSNSECCVLHNLQFTNAGPACKRPPYGRGIFESRSHNCFVSSHECLLLFTPSCCSECFYNLQWLVCLY